MAGEGLDHPPVEAARADDQAEPGGGVAPPEHLLLGGELAPAVFRHRGGMGRVAADEELVRRARGGGRLGQARGAGDVALDAARLSQGCWASRARAASTVFSSL